MITRRDLIVALIAASGTLAVVDSPAAHAVHPEVTGVRLDGHDAQGERLWRRAVAGARADGDAQRARDARDDAQSWTDVARAAPAPNEELIILREGTLETLSLGEWKRIGPGSIIFNASNDLHGVKNVGTVPAVYHVVNWKSTMTPVK